MLIARDTDSCPDEDEPDAYFLGRGEGISPACKKRPRDQTNEEWLAEYCSADEYRAAKSGEYTPSYNVGKNEGIAGTPNALHQDDQHALVDYPAVPVSTACGISPTTGLCFRYIDHHTTRTGSVVLLFETLDGQIKASAFFNVDLKNNRGRSYPSGKRGQFIPPRMGKFVKLWMKVVGRAPARWSRVYRSIRSNFGDIIFSGTLTEETDSQGQSYYKLRDVAPMK